MMNSDIIKEVRQELINNSDAEARESGKRFFKEDIDLYGVKSSVTENIGKTLFKKLDDSSKDDVFELCEQLWKSGKMEESFIACNWSYALRKKYASEDFKIFERWVENYVSNWASCDTLCNHTVGTLIDMYPVLISDLKQWSHSSNRWMKRASAVSLIIPARHGRFLGDIFDIACTMLTDKDDMVQKGYGWMLKAASQAHQKEVFDFVMKNKKVMPRTSLRYAIEKMPPDLKKEAMAK